MYINTPRIAIKSYRFLDMRACERRLKNTYSAPLRVIRNDDVELVRSQRQ